MNRFRHYAPFATSFGLAVFSIAILAVNRGLWLVGISTVAADAPGAPKGLFDLLVAIANLPWWALLILSVLLVGLHLRMASKLGHALNQSAAAHSAAKDALTDIVTVKTDIQSSIQKVLDKLDQVEKSNHRKAFAAYHLHVMQNSKREADLIWEEIGAVDQASFPPNWQKWEEMANKWAELARLATVEALKACGKDTDEYPHLSYASQDTGARRRVGAMFSDASPEAISKIASVLVINQIMQHESARAIAENADEFSSISNV